MEYSPQPINYIIECLQTREIPCGPEVVRVLNEGVQRLKGNDSDTLVQVVSDLASKGIPSDTALKSLAAITGIKGPDYNAARIELYSLPTGGE